MSRRIAICAATYCRPDMLRRTLQSIAALEIPDGYEVEIRIVDNDATGSARDIVEECRRDLALPGPLEYDIEPEQNIALARNRLVDMGPVDFVAMLDDDEVAPRDWLTELFAAMERESADGACGPVEAREPDSAPRWLVRGRFHSKPTGRVGEPLDWRLMRTSNVLINGRWFYDRGFRFDPSFGRSGGEDTDLFGRLIRAGAVFAAAPKACPWEDVEPDRLSLRWLVTKQYRHGLKYDRLTQDDPDRRHPAFQFVARLTKGLIETAVGVPTLVIGRPEACVRGLMTLSLGLGGLVAWLRPQQTMSTVQYGARTAEPSRRAA